MKRYAAVVLLMLAPSAASGGYYETGNDIYDGCTTKQQVGFCLAYAAGIADAAYFTPMSGICIPLGVQLSQVRDVMVGYLDEHPETRHEPAYYLVNRALIEAWPC
jgi:hypothetical protein